VSATTSKPVSAADLAQYDGLPPGQRGWAMAATGVAIGMATLDTAIANTALPSIAQSLHTDAAASIWVVNAYQLAVVAAVLPFASLGDIVGHRRVYVAGVVIFTLASLACGMSDSLWTLSLSRLLQGLGGAAIMSVNTALIRFIYPRKTLGRGYGLNAMVVAVCFAIGPTIASAILSVADWPYLFLVNVPFGLVAALLGARMLPATAPSRGGFDYLAGALSALFFAGFALGLGEAVHAAPVWRVLSEWGVSALACALLIRRQRRDASPMLPVDLFKIPLFSLSAATATCSFATQGLAFVSLPFLFEHMLGRSEVETGFLMTPWPVVVAIMAPIAGRLVERYSAGLLGGFGLIWLSLGMALLAMLPAHASAFDIGWRMLICGGGFGFFQSPNMKALMESAPPHRSGGASGVVATARLIGQMTGAALVAAAFVLASNNGPRLALWLGCGFAAAASLASILRVFTTPGAQGAAQVAPQGTD
jgi:DHA2 family multidrug resistance protein-like MFS transporter